jgi:hypothetical protein
MDDEIKKHEPKVLADNQGIAIGEINILKLGSLQEDDGAK